MFYDKCLVSSYNTLIDDCSCSAQLLKLVSHAVFYGKCLVSSYNTLIDATAHVLAVEKVSQIFPDVIEPALRRLRVARGYPREQHEVHNLYTGAADSRR